MGEIDLTDYVGETVDGETWQRLQAECRHRHGNLWTMHAQQVAEGWHIQRLVVTGNRTNQSSSWAARNGAV